MSKNPWSGTDAALHGVYDRRRIVQLSHSAIGGMKNIHIEKNTHFKNIRANENSEREEEV